MADERLRDAEGYGLERLVAQLYEERSRKGLGDFPLTERIDGYWDKAGTEIDLVAVNDEQRVIRFGICKRTAEKLLRCLAGDEAHIAGFLEALPKYKHYRVERAAIAPALTSTQADAAHARGWDPAGPEHAHARALTEPHCVEARAAARPLSSWVHFGTHLAIRL